MNTLGRLEINPKVMLGKPVIRGTRIPMETILRELSERMTETDLLDAYPTLNKGDVAGVLRYVADVIAHEEILIFEPAEDSAV